MDSPGSDLSDYASDDFPEDVKGRQHSMEPTPDHDLDQRPNKRPRLNLRAPSSPPAHINVMPPDEDGDVSEDTDGSVPASPNHHPGMSQDDDFGQDQVTVCKWEGCQAGDLQNMDNLVEHLHDDHIGTRQKKYSCEWSDCSRKGIPHASGYALRAHMRSHTREKPFYCTLPECDRSFTRSDALAKHMRTVHETEALRPSDPVPKHHSSNPSNKSQRLKLVLNFDAKKPHDKGSTPASPSSHSHPPNSATVPPAPASDADYAHNNVVYLQDLASPNAPIMVQFPPDIDFTPEELRLPAPDLFKLLRRQLQWATQDGEELRAEAERLERQRKEEWEAKELLFENHMEAQAAYYERRRVDEGLPAELEGFPQVQEDVAPSRQLPLTPKNGKLPWWRDEAQLHQQAGALEIKEESSVGRPPPADIKHEEPGPQIATA
ncbi:Nn.00g018790.m01.CDS01 [Neocucurbitaria sp. VM-36]